MAGANTFLNCIFCIKKMDKGKIANIAVATRKWTGTNSVGVVPNLIPYRIKLSIIFLRFKIKNITPARLINPRNFWVGDYPLKIDICLTRLGTNAKQLLYFLFLSMFSLSPSIAILEDLIVASLTWKISPLFFTGGI